MIKSRQVKIQNLLMFICSVICIIYNSGYAYSTYNENLGLYILFVVTIPVFFICLYYKIFDNLTIQKRAFLLFVSVSAISIIVNASFYTATSFALPLLMMTFGFCISNLVDFDTFCSYFIKAMRLITIVSLVLYAIDIFSIIEAPIFSNINNKRYYNGIIYFQLLHEKERNMAMFWEPGLFASFLLFALILGSFFVKKRISVIDQLLFFAGIITTRSTAGYMLAVLVLVLYLTRRIKNKKVLIALFAAVFILAVIFFDDIYNAMLLSDSDIFVKLFEKKGSVYTRLNGPLLNLKIFLKNPIFGAGFRDADNAYAELMKISSGIGAQTSTSTYFMAALGIFGSAYTFLWMYGIGKIRSIDVISRILIITIILLILNKEPHNNILFTYCFLFYILKKDMNYTLSDDIQEAHNVKYNLLFEK